MNEQKISGSGLEWKEPKELAGQLDFPEGDLHTFCPDDICVPLNNAQDLPDSPTSALLTRSQKQEFFNSWIESARETVRTTKTVKLTLQDKRAALQEAESHILPFIRIGNAQMMARIVMALEWDDVFHGHIIWATKQKFINNTGFPDFNVDPEGFRKLQRTADITDVSEGLEKGATNPWRAMLTHYKQTVRAKFLDSLTNKKDILICCSDGKSRSVTFVTLFLMEFLGLSADVVLNFIKSKRHITDPRQEFLAGLRSLK